MGRIVNKTEHELKRKEGALFLRFSMDLAKAQLQNGGFFCFEHPATVFLIKGAQTKSLSQACGCSHETVVDRTARCLWFPR